MMKLALTALALSILTGACASNGQYAKMDARIAKMERENQALRRQNAVLQRQVAPKPAPATLPQTQQPAQVGGRAWVRQSHGQYVCVKDYDAHLAQRSRIRFENKVDDRYGIRPARNDSWVSFTLNGQPVAIVRSTLAGPAVQYHLGPNESCYVQLSGAEHYKVVATLHKNVGSRQMPQLKETPKKKSWEWMDDFHTDEYPFVFQRHHF